MGRVNPGGAFSNRAGAYGETPLDLEGPLYGNFADRPDITEVGPGFIYIATDTDAGYVSSQDGQWLQINGGATGTIEEITSIDNSVFITDPTGPVTDLSVTFPAAITEITSVDMSVTITNPTGPTADLSVAASGSAKRGLTLVVAASDALASSIAGADYVCDGTDDDVEIQQALDILSNAGIGGRVLLTEGNFNIAQTISVPVGCILQGVGFDTITAGTSINSQVGFTSTTYAIGADGPVLDLVIYCASRSRGLELGTFSNVYLHEARLMARNVYVYSPLVRGISCTYGENHLVDTCVVKSSGGYGIFIADYDTVINCYTESSSNYGYFLAGVSSNCYHCRSVLDTGGYLLQNDEVGLIACYADSGITNPSISLSSSTNAKVIGCRISTGQIGIQGNPTAATVIGNTFYSVGGTSIDEVCGIIEGNTVLAGSGHGISLTGTISQTKIANNIVSGPSQVGINLAGTLAAADASVNVSGNIVTGCGQHGINVDMDAVVSGNECYLNSSDTTNTYDDIIVQSVSAVTWNRCHRNTTTTQPKYGLEITAGATSAFVYGNDLRTANAYGTAQFVDNGVGTLTALAASGQRT